MKDLAANFYGLQKDIKRDLLNIDEKINSCTYDGNSSQEQRLSRVTKLEDVEKRIEQLKPSFEQLDIKSHRYARSTHEQPSMQSEVAEKVQGSKEHLANLLLKINTIKQSATTACMEEDEASRELDSLGRWLKQKNADLDNFSSIPTDMQKIEEHFTKDFSQLHDDILAKESEILVTSGKVAEVLNKSPNPELKKKLLHLNQQWPILLSDLKERQQLVEKTKKILAELSGLETKVKKQLVETKEEMENQSKNTDKIDLQPAKNKLAEVESGIESCFGLIDKLNNISELAEKCQLDTKKRLPFYERNLKSKNELRNKFESEVNDLQQLIDTTRNTFKLDKSDDGQGFNDKEALKQGLAELEAKWQRGIQDLQNTAAKLRQVVDESEKKRSKKLSKIVICQIYKPKKKCLQLTSELEDASQAIAKLTEEWKGLQDTKMATVSQSSSAQRDLDRLARQTVERDVASILVEMDEISKSELLLVQPVPSSQLRQQQEAIQEFKANQLKHISAKVEEVQAKCKESIRSASNTVPTSHVEGTMTKGATIGWSNSSLGNYNEAYKSLVNWLEETEELVNNQKPPSADYKVVRAQLQNHDFQLKLVDDKQQGCVEGFLSMIERMQRTVPESSAEENGQMKSKAEEVSSRYNGLVEW
uniref:Dystrophin n=1 Tax=Ditylenchus dipsaci TaxID=166011 RepID=A0A915EIX9_9BILA